MWKLHIIMTLLVLGMNLVFLNLSAIHFVFYWKTDVAGVGVQTVTTIIGQTDSVTL